VDGRYDEDDGVVVVVVVAKSCAMASAALARLRSWLLSLPSWSESSSLVEPSLFALGWMVNNKGFDRSATSKPTTRRGTLSVVDACSECAVVASGWVKAGRWSRRLRYSANNNRSFSSASLLSDKIQRVMSCGLHHPGTSQ